MIVPARDFILPNQIEEELENLAMQRNESQGVLIYSSFIDSNRLLCPIFYFYKTGEGTPERVTANAKKIETINRFFREDFHDGNFSDIAWHSHTVETLRLFGNQFGTRFSQGDERVIEMRTPGNPLYTAMLTTPYGHLIRGKGDLTLSFVDYFKGFKETNLEIKNKLRSLEI